MTKKIEQLHKGSPLSGYYCVVG